MLVFVRFGIILMCFHGSHLDDNRNVVFLLLKVSRYKKHVLGFEPWNLHFSPLKVGLLNLVELTWKSGTLNLITLLLARMYFLAW